MSINDRFEKDVKKNKTAGINDIFNPTQTYSEQTLRVLDNIKNKSEEVQLPAKETNITSQTPMFENTRIQAPVKQNFGSKVANFFKVTLPNAIEDTWDDIKEPITGPSLKQVMTEAKISPQMLKEDAQKQLAKENPTREDYALVKQTKEAVQKFGMEDSKFKAMDGDNTQLLSDLKDAEKTWQVSPVDALGANALGAGASMFGNLGSFANSLGADKVPVLKEVTNFAVEGARKAQENAQQYNKGDYGEALGTVTQGVVNLVPYFVLGTGKVAAKGATAVTKYGKYIEPIIKNPSFWYSLSSMWGQKYQEKLNEGYNRAQALGNAIMYAVPSALIEVSGGIGAQGKEAQTLLRTIGEEIGEELAQDIVSGISDKTVTNHDLPVFSMTEDAIINPNNMLETALYTAPIVAIGGGGSRVANTINQNKIESAKKQVQIRNDLDNYKHNSEYSKYIPQVQTSQIENLIPGFKTDVQKLPVTQLVQGDNGINRVGQENSQNGNINQTNESFQNAPEMVQKQVEEVQNISKSIGRTVNFFELDDAEVNGYIKDGVIYLNKNNPNMLKQTYIHELTHYIEDSKEYSKFANEIFNSNIFEEFLLNKGKTFNEYQAAIKEAYSKHQIELDEDGINREIVAKFAEEKLFNTQEDINRLAEEKPTLVAKIKQIVDDLVVKFTGTSQEKELRRIQKMYKTALEEARSVKSSNNTVQYSYSGEVGLENLQNNKKYMNKMQKEFVNELENNYQNAIYLSKQGYTNDQILKATGWFKSDGKWKWEIPDEYFSIKDSADLSNGEHDLSEIIEHDLIFMVYPDLANKKVKISNAVGKSFYNSVNDTIYLKIGGKSKNAIELNLLHELQHAIQAMEGFDGGTSTLGGMLRYYEKHGEIEAADTVRRFKRSKTDETFDREKVAPELSKDNPKHPTLDKYLAGETKKQTPIRDSLYQKSKEKGNGIYEKLDKKAFGMEADETDNGKNMRNNNGGRFRGYVKNTAGKQPAFSMPTDNKGKELSEKQKEYFKYSKIRDDKGRLIEVYHRTNQDFTQFDKNKIGSATDDGFWGRGFYFSNLDHEHYGKNVIKGYLNITNPLVMRDFKSIQEIAEYLDIVERNFHYEPDGLIRVSYDQIRQFTSHVIEKGHDGVIAEHDNGVCEYVIFEPNQIKDVTNTEPTENPDIRYSISDNQGRELSKEQQEFFKDSKVRDEQGRLMEVYHGTNEDFTVFDKSYLGTGSGDLGFLGDGFYFATHKGEAGYYGGKVMPVYLNIKNPYNLRNLFKYNGKYLNGEDNSTYLKIANLVSLHKEWADIEIESTTYGDIQKEVQGFLDNVEMKYLGKAEDSNGKEFDYWSVKYKDFSTREMTIEGYSEDSLKADCLNDYMKRKVGYINSSDVMQYITEYSRFEGGKSLADVLQEKGYDGIFQDEDIGDEIVVFNPEQIKNVDNANPTKNPDIRYSITDNQGRKLSKEQQDYFKNSKIRDAEGNLLEVYHGTNKGGFTVFSGGTFGVNYYTDKVAVAKSYTSENFEDNKIYSGYVNIEKPLVVDVQGRKWSAIRRDFIEDDDILKIIDKDLGNKYNIFSTTDITIAAKESGKYDGVIFKNIYDFAYSTKDELSDVYATFNSNQFKNIDNKKPTTNPDIRYSMNVTSKSQQYQRRKENMFLKDVSNALGISEFADRKAMRATVAEIAEEIKSGNYKRRDELFEKIFAEGIAVNDEFYNQYKTLKSNIRNTKLYVSKEVQDNIADYNDFRKSNMGRLTLTSDDSAMKIDTFYKELNEEYPELFPITINTLSDQLNRMAEVSKSIEKVKTEISRYAENNAEYKSWAKNEFDKSFDKLISEMNIVTRAENDKKVAKEELEVNKVMADNVTIEELKEAYKTLQNLRKDYEKLNRKELLSKKDRVTLDRLLKGEITFEEIPKESNIEGIKKLYSAKQPISSIENVLKQYNAIRKESLKKQAEEAIKNSNAWKEKLTGIQYAREIMERNFVDVAGKEDGKILNEIYAEPVHINEAEATRLKNKYRKQIEELNLSDKEIYEVSYVGEFKQGRNPDIQEKPAFNMVSERGLVQLYGEGKINEVTLKRLDADVNKIKNAVSTFRNIYNELIELSNDSLVANGYAPVEYRKDYFPHFVEDKGDSLLSKFGSVIGIEVNTKELPTDIAGLTHTFRPGKKWVGNFLQRTSEITDFDAVKGFDRYIEGVADVIFHTEDIQRLRALEDAIRYKYSDKGVQEQIDAIREDDNIAAEDKRNRIEEIYQTNKNEFPHLVSWLRSYTDSLAGKKSIEDRIAEQQLGRIVYDISKSVENRVSANMIGLNINSWLTNFIPVAQATGTTKGKHLLNAMKDTIRSYAADDGLRDRSTFLTNRVGSEPLVKTFNQKLASSLDGMRIIDNFTSETLVRARYYQNMANGMTQEEALKEADRNTAKIMGDRSKGSVPTLFNAKNPVTKLMTMFQLEQNNQFSYYFKDVPDELKEKGAKIIRLALAKIFIASWLYNEVKEELTGSRSAFDPIDIAINLGKNIKNKGFAGTGDTVLELLESTPFIGGLLGGGRIPISSALPDISALLKGESSLGKEMIKPLTYLIPPMGGGQIKKTIEGLDTFIKGGNYGKDNQGRKTLKYPVEKDIGNAMKSVLFGRYSTEYAQDYIDNGFKSLSAKQTEGYEKAREQGVSYDVFMDAYFAQKDVKGDKNAKGETIDLSASRNKKKAIDELIPGYTKKQKQSLYEAFGISEKVWNK